MIGSQFYHETTRDIVVAFGSMFNNIYLTRKDRNGNVTQSMKVPLAYGPKQKWLSRLTEDPKLTKKDAVTLPRLGFEIKAIAYDTNRKLNKAIKVTKKQNSEKNDQLLSSYMPVPYNLNFELYAFSKNSDDALQIVEQILPYFQPEFMITINERSEIGITRDVPIVLNSISYEDVYEGDFIQRRSIVYTLDFTAKFYLYGPVKSEKVIKSVQVDQYANLPTVSPAREQRYTVEPDPITATYDDDDFGFNETTSYFEDAKTYNPTTGQDE